MKQKNSTLSSESGKTKIPLKMRLQNRRKNYAPTIERLKRNKILRRWQLYLMFLPALVYVILFCYKPMYGIIIAFKEYKIRKGIWGSEWVGLEHFERLFKSYWFPIILKNTVTTSLLCTLLTFPIPIIVALMANEIKNQKLKKGFQIVSYAPHFVTTVVVCSMISLFLNPTSGVIALAVEAITGTAPRWLTDPEAFKWIYIVSQGWQTCGWGAMIYYATLSSVDPHLLEAAQIDGANKLQRIIHVNLPRLGTMISIMLIMRIGNVMSVGYEKVYLMQNDLNLIGSEVISTYVYKMGIEKGSFSFSTAVGLFNSGINCILLIISNSVSKKMGSKGMW